MLYICLRRLSRYAASTGCSGVSSRANRFDVAADTSLCGDLMIMVKV